MTRLILCRTIFWQSYFFGNPLLKFEITPFPHINATMLTVAEAKKLTVAKLKDQLKTIPQKDGETNKAYKLRALRELRAGKKTQKPSPKAKATT